MNPLEYGYLELDYLVWPYLAGIVAQATAAQATILVAKTSGVQTRIIIYNTNRPRILCDFPSRGASTTGGGNNAWGYAKGIGFNWIATNQATGDFTPNNLNTDIPEQVFRSSTTSVTISCDTEVNQGVAVDTLGILSHNLSSSAVVTLEASNSSVFSPVLFTTGLTWTRTDMYYIASDFPFTQYRYWRLVISDPNSADGYVQIGVIVFGNASIFPSECFVDSVRRRRTHYKDVIPTEGFTNVSNDRAFKRQISLEFRNLTFGGPAYMIMNDMFETDKTSLKCLWIPDPQAPTRLGIFAKLANIPEETQRNLGTNADYVDFTVELDEAL